MTVRAEKYVSSCDRPVCITCSLQKIVPSSETNAGKRWNLSRDLSYARRLFKAFRQLIGDETGIVCVRKRRRSAAYARRLERRRVLFASSKQSVDVGSGRRDTSIETLPKAEKLTTVLGRTFDAFRLDPDLAADMQKRHQGVTGKSNTSRSRNILDPLYPTTGILSLGAIAGRVLTYDFDAGQALGKGKNILTESTLRAPCIRSKALKHTGVDSPIHTYNWIAKEYTHDMVVKNQLWGGGSLRADSDRSLHGRTKSGFQSGNDRSFYTTGMMLATMAANKTSEFKHDSGCELDPRFRYSTIGCDTEPACRYEFGLTLYEHSIISREQFVGSLVSGAPFQYCYLRAVLPSCWKYYKQFMIAPALTFSEFLEFIERVPVFNRHPGLLDLDLDSCHLSYGGQGGGRVLTCTVAELIDHLTDLSVRF